MTIDWSSFTPGPALAGGLLIGLAASLLVAFNGRIAGISGILGGVLRPGGADRGWRLAFLAGLVGAPLVYGLVLSSAPGRFQASLPVLALAGLLVGLGTRYGSGCTSGHGVCGISRLSRRSLVATGVFMAAGFAATFAVRHLFKF